MDQTKITDGYIVRVGLGTCGIAAGGMAVYEALAREIEEGNLDLPLEKTGCIGMCYEEVLVDVISPSGDTWAYGRVTPEMVPRIIREHILGGQAVKEWLVRSPGKEPEFLSQQKRVALQNCGRINPESLDGYRAQQGYQALEKAINSLRPSQVIDEVFQSGLRGRGGAGFPTGFKWRATREAAGEPKYIVCNADEGDPGAFMDRSVLEGDPHGLLEGMIIAGYAVGAQEGYIYIRAEYPLAIERLKKALSQAEAAGFLGENILGSSFSFHIHIAQGAGAFVCGEETALLNSLEGDRGMPRLKPPFPAQSGLWNQPTNINNVETFANIPWIIRHGAEAFAAFGQGRSKGTKVFALAGKVIRGGLVEVPMGVTLREVIYDIGGGIKDGKAFKAIQIGGPSGGCIPAQLLDTPVTYEDITKTGAIVGSGGMIVVDETTCMVDLARFFLDFVQKESCGKCINCRIGTKRMLEILTRITTGKGKEGDLELLEDLALRVKEGSLCGLGQTAPNPVLTTLRYFRDEYEAHIRDKKCPARSCKALIQYKIDPQLCIGCGICKRNCPVEAISGEPQQAHSIDQEVCTRCNTCYEVCPVKAISVD